MKMSTRSTRASKAKSEQPSHLSQLSGPSPVGSQDEPELLLHSILAHRQNPDNNEYEFQVKWLNGKKTQTEWNGYEDLVSDPAIMRTVYDYTVAHLQLREVRTVRLGMMGSRTKTLDDSPSDEDYEVSLGSDEEVKVGGAQKSATPQSNTVQTGSRPSRKCASKGLTYTEYFDDYFESNLAAED